MQFKQRLPYTTLFLAVVFLCVQTNVVYAGTLTCSITTAAACTGTVIYRMSGTSNAHAELPSQATAAYDSNVVCCSGVTGLSNSCTAPSANALNLTAATNSHASQTATSPYTTPACISVPSGGTVSIDYQVTNCAGFDTTLGSMSATTNAHVGNSAAYAAIQICGTATGAAQTLTFSVSQNTITFGTLDSAAARFADTDIGSATEVEAYTLSASTNAASGYTITVKGATLTHTNPAFTITAIGGTAINVTTPGTSIGTEQFGIRMVATGGVGEVTAPYNGAANFFGYNANASTTAQVASATTGNGVTTTYSARYAANIAPATEAGSYTTTLTHVATGNF